MKEKADEDENLYNYTIIREIQETDSPHDEDDEEFLLLV